MNNDTKNTQTAPAEKTQEEAMQLVHELQQVTLAMLKDIDKVCAEYNIPYYLGEGTMPGTLTLSGGLITGNKAGMEGGAILVKDSYAALEVSGAPNVTDNSAPQGGGRSGGRIRGDARAGGSGGGRRVSE